MSSIRLKFDLNWVNEKKARFGNIIRKLEKESRSIESAKLIKTDSDSMAFEIDDSHRKDLVEMVIRQMSEVFGEDNPWGYVDVSGDLDGLDYGAKMQAGQDKKEASKPAPEPEPAPVASEERDILRSIETESAPHQPIKEVHISASEKVKTTIEELQSHVPLVYSPALTNYILKVRDVLPQLMDMNSMDCFWAHTLLVSIDAGFGYSSFLKGLGDLYEAFGLAETSKDDDHVHEVVTPENFELSNEPAWEHLLEWVTRNARQEGKRAKKILSIDISKSLGVIHTERFREVLRQIADYSKNYTVIFRVPFMESHVVRRVSDILGDIFALETIEVSPTTMDNMVDYIIHKIDSLNCKVEEGCEDQLEQLVFQEKRDDSFFGYKTLGKISRNLVYQKAVRNISEEHPNFLITAQDINSLLEVVDSDTDPYEAMNLLIGMKEVKEKIREIVAQVKTQKELADEGKSVERPCIHMFFTGNPGTGKTTVARLVGRIMRQENILRKGNFYEVKGRDLCGQYIGQTAPKTSSICRDAYGSVLFIDEAYSLYTGGANDRDYGREAITTLIAEMENHRDDMCVIFAGYEDDMSTLLKGNPGLESRVPYTLKFPNYSREELEEIFFSLMDQNFQYDEELHETLHKYLEKVPDEVFEKKNFANGRTIRNLYERVWGKAAYRRNLSGEKELVIRKEDMNLALQESDFEKISDIEDKKDLTVVGFAAD